MITIGLVVWAVAITVAIMVMIIVIVVRVQMLKMRTQKRSKAKVGDSESPPSFQDSCSVVDFDNFGRFPAKKQKNNAIAGQNPRYRTTAETLSKIIIPANGSSTS
jgi:hypothetical protein